MANPAVRESWALRVVFIGLLVATGAFFFALAMAGPTTPGLTPEQRWLANLGGALLGWLWALVGLVLLFATNSEFRPSVPSIFVIAGVGLMAVFNGTVVGDAGQSLILRATGYAVLAALAIYAGWALYHSPWADHRRPE